MGLTIVPGNMIEDGAVTGSNIATGVIDPVLPTLAMISLITVSACSALNLPAIAHLGDLLLTPSIVCSEYELTLKILFIHYVFI